MRPNVHAYNPNPCMNVHMCVHMCMDVRVSVSVRVCMCLYMHMSVFACFSACDCLLKLTSIGVNHWEVVPCCKGSHGKSNTNIV